MLSEMTGELEGTEIPLRCAACGKPKPNDLAWARPAIGCTCSGTLWVGTVTFSPSVARPDNREL